MTNRFDRADTKNIDKASSNGGNYNNIGGTESLIQINNRSSLKGGGEALQMSLMKEERASQVTLEENGVDFKSSGY